MQTIYKTFGDTIVMSQRILKHNLRSVDTIITVIAMPVMMMLASVYIFGGAMDIGESYINYIVPGILILCVITGVAYTAYRLNNDVTKGIFERFHSMPISKSSILGGHVLTSIIFSVISVIAVIVVSLLIGFSPSANIINWLQISFVIILFTIAMTWISVLFGLICKSYETAGVFTYILMGLVFTSSGFAPTSTMAKGLATFAKYQPMSPIIDSIRSLMQGSNIDNNFYIAIVWCIGIWLVFNVLSMKVYKSIIK